MLLVLPFVASQPIVLAHVMPWFEAPPTSPEYGWHWSMGKTEPAKGILASHYRPLIGPYDSGDPNVLEAQVLWMKFAGIGGITIDWYGLTDHFDYATIHRNTLALIRTAKRAGLKFAIVYEDQTVPQLIKAGKTTELSALADGKKLMEWVDRTWFSDPAYLRWQGRPVFLVFGPQYYQSDAWVSMLSGIKSSPAFLTLHHRKGSADGAFDWPLPQGGTAGAMAQIERFATEAKAWKLSMPVAFPRFHDFYAEAGLHASYGTIEDREGRTFSETLKRGLATSAPFVQIATWNDWGEGTAIEPSTEVSFRDLETTQRATRCRFIPSDLRLPLRLWKLRSKRHPLQARTLDRIADLLYRGETRKADEALATLERRSIG